MTTHDYNYNGIGRWSRHRIIERYREYAERFHLDETRDLTPVTHTERGVTWIYPVMQKVIEGIEAGDRACTAIGVEFIQEDQKFSFGKILKSNTARALRRADLSEGEKETIRKRIVNMLLAGNVPHEFKEYAKLLRSIGFADHWREIDERAVRTNPYVMRWHAYLEKHLVED